MARADVSHLTGSKNNKEKTKKKNTNLQHGKDNVSVRY